MSQPYVVMAIMAVPLLVMLLIVKYMDHKDL